MLELLGGVTETQLGAADNRALVNAIASDEHTGSEPGSTSRGNLSDAADPGVDGPEICAAVLMAPLCSVFDRASLERIQVPIKIYTAGNDEVISNRFNGNWLRGNLSDAEFEELENAGHFVFMAKKNDDAALVHPAAIGPSSEFDTERVHRKLENDVVAFFDVKMNSFE